MTSTNLSEIVLKRDGFYSATRKVCPRREYYSDWQLSCKGPIYLMIGKKINRKIKSVAKPIRINVPRFNSSVSFNTKRFYQRVLSYIAREHPEGANAFRILDDHLGWVRDKEAEEEFPEEFQGEHDRLAGIIYKIKYYHIV